MLALCWFNLWKRENKDLVNNCGAYTGRITQARDTKTLE
jgi:hypothetical protein